MLCPIPFLLFLKGASHSNKSKGFNILCTLMIINFIITNIITMVGIANYHSMLYTTHILIVASMILSFFTIIKEILYYKSAETNILAISIAVLGTSSLIDFIKYYLNNTGDLSLNFRIGLLLFIVMIGFSTLKKMLIVIKMGINTSAVQQLAFNDILTHIKNRTAYMKELDDLNKTLTPNTNIIVVMFDLNNLKEANDTYGHEAGDTMIIAAAECIKKSLNGYGICYRIGGDEFAAIIRDVYDSTFFDCMYDLDHIIEAYNQKNAIMLEIPYGYTHYDATIDNDLYATFSRADALMYEAKAKMKSDKTSK
jgi:diguanylate cyclase (GGDEF)-like protein